MWIRLADGAQLYEDFTDGSGEVSPPPEPATPNQPGEKTCRPIMPATGEKIYADADYAGIGAAALNFTRHYRSSRVVGATTDAATTGLGQAWSHNHAATLQQTNGTAPTAGSGIAITFGEGTIRTFTWDVLVGQWKPTNSADTLSSNVLNGTPGLLYQRSDDDSRWQFNTLGALTTQPTTVTQRNGWTTRYTYNASGKLTTVANPFGRSITLGYNTQGQLSTVQTPDGQILRYTFDSAQRLLSVVYPGNTSKTYLYENSTFPQLITGIVDENGSRLATVQYDAQGRAVESGYAGGADRYTVSYPASAGATTTVTDPLGTQRSYAYGTTFGKLTVTSASLPSGSGGADAASRVQNASGLIDLETDFLGVQTMYTWDINRRLPVSTTKAVGKPEAQTTATQWHPTFKLPVLVTEAGRTTAYTYDTAGNPLSQTQTDSVSGQTRSQSWTYNPQNQVLAATDALGHVTNYTYYPDTAFTGVDPNAVGHTIGDLQTITNPAGFITTFNSYDKTGRILKMTDPKGIVTDMTYTPRGWVNTVTTTAPGQSARVTTYAYDFVGQLTGVANPDGSTLAYTYDAAHRPIGATDAKGNSVTYTLDNMGNRIKEDIKDPSGVLQRSIDRSFDALNRLQQVSGAVQ